MSVDIEFLSAVIVISDEPRRLAGFYGDALGLPLHPEQHDDDLPHWGATLGQLHFAIHHVADFPEHRVPARERSSSPWPWRTSMPSSTASRVSASSRSTRPRSSAGPA